MDNKEANITYQWYACLLNIIQASFTLITILAFAIVTKIFNIVVYFCIILPFTLLVLNLIRYHNIIHDKITPPSYSDEYIKKKKIELTVICGIVIMFCICVMVMLVI